MKLPFFSSFFGGGGGIRRSNSGHNRHRLQNNNHPHNHSNNNSGSHHHHHFSSSSSKSRSSSCKWSRILIVALCQMAFVLTQEERKVKGNNAMSLNVMELGLNYIRDAAMKDPPKFSETIPNVTVAVGRDASLPCVVENLEKHKVAWVHIDRRMILTIHRHIVTKIPRFSVSFDSAKTWLLHINSVQQEDRGYYMCQVNTEPMISQVGYLQVVVPPNILDDDSSESHVAVREHQNITLSCKAEGFPEPRITWKREDGEPFAVDRRKRVNVSEGERLHLFKISRVEMGAYLCIASNGVPPSVSKRITVDVEFQPMIWVPNQLVGAPKGTNVTLECNTEAYPRAISYWVYDNMMILTTGKYHAENSDLRYKTQMRLTIRNLRDKDFGKYKCISKNSLGETEGAIRLYEIPLPSAPPRATEVKQDKHNPVGVVRLNPISKSDEKWIKSGKGERDGKSFNRPSYDSSANDATGGGSSSSGGGQSGDSVRVPRVDLGSSATDSSGTFLRPLFTVNTVGHSATKYLTAVTSGVLSWNFVLWLTL